MSKISSKISSVDQEKFQAFLQQILRNVKTQEDPRVLDAYRRLFRKSVPFSMRSYVAAHLAHTHCRAGATAGSTRRTGAREGIRTGSVHAPSCASAPASAARARDFERKARDYPALCPGDTTSIFISIGKNRHIYPRDIIALLMQRADVAREHIGTIRILDHYSFIQVLSGEAEAVIARLNGLFYRGRTLTVSHSRRADEHPAPSTEPHAAAVAPEPDFMAEPIPALEE